MKREAIKWITIIVKWLSIALGSSAIALQQLPDEWAFWAVLAFAIASGLKDTLVNVVDALDDGKLNQSYK